MLPARARSSGADLRPDGHHRRPNPSAPPSVPISRVPYLPGLDGMRALAVVAVMVYHANSDWLHGGFLGVEVFFVISGYLITLLLIAEHERTGRIEPRPVLAAARPATAAGAVHDDAARHGRVCACSCATTWASCAATSSAGVCSTGRNWFQIWTGRGVHGEQRVRAAAAPLEPGRRGAVLPGLAVGDDRASCVVGAERLPRIGAWLFVHRRSPSPCATALLYHPGVIGSCTTDTRPVLQDRRAMPVADRHAVPRHDQPGRRHLPRRRLRHVVAAVRRDAQPAAQPRPVARHRRARRRRRIGVADVAGARDVRRARRAARATSGCSAAASC